MEFFFSFFFCTVYIGCCCLLSVFGVGSFCTGLLQQKKGQNSIGIVHSWRWIALVFDIKVSHIP